MNNTIPNFTQFHPSIGVLPNTPIRLYIDRRNWVGSLGGQVTQSNSSAILAQRLVGSEGRRDPVTSILHAYTPNRETGAVSPRH